jgi:coenzyme PQQ precursor peptide PqqA
MKRGGACIFGAPANRRSYREVTAMAWKTPRVVDISLALEINGHACAEID